VGTIGFKILDNFAIIRKMFVAKNFRGSPFKTAQKLLHALEAQITLKNIHSIYLGTTEFFKAAHQFYERNGYTEIQKEKLPPTFPIMKIDTKFYYKALIISQIL
jgi:N-acetylglutamate synthase-like GNAT family acetyltransferase